MFEEIKSLLGLSRTIDSTWGNKKRCGQYFFCFLYSHAWICIFSGGWDGSVM